MDVLGGGILLAVAAVLWIAYLLPSWVRRGQYLATERNTVRLQQTLRILAETSETPEPVTVEANARAIAEQERLLRRQERAAEHEADARRALAEAEEKAARLRAAEARRVAAATVREASGAARRRLRRRRAMCSLGLLLSLVTVVVGLVGLAFGMSEFVALAGGAGMVASLGGIVALARRGVAPAATVQPAASDAPAHPQAAFEPIEFAQEAVEGGWTPQPLPKPLVLSRGTIAATAMASIEAAEQLRRAASEAELEQRAAAMRPDVTSIAARVTGGYGSRIAGREAAAPARSDGHAAPVRPPQPHGGASAVEEAAAPPSRYASMGVVGDTEPGLTDLDAVLRRRRVAG
ncbi:hypothetical protein ARHIZOSPH14_24340 [Agromyces rhizosphaerae]|uniref:Large exoprotein n=1 Tax=Agromyces rhizosphaerae TaxID=88374 RepID=A0A9W6CZR8_9MICO|nr:hypothetical protein [Agromyces rhizosphaerae]GLI28192.1 hypothetical protein ARHIZOSPH14_24340 [Agromyces rhizosphaerae]